MASVEEVRDAITACVRRYGFDTVTVSIWDEAQQGWNDTVSGDTVITGRVLISYTGDEDDVDAEGDDCSWTPFDDAGLEILPVDARLTTYANWFDVFRTESSTGYVADHGMNIRPSEGA